MVSKRTQELLQADAEKVVHPMHTVGKNRGMVMEKAHGIYMVDTEGKEYIDLTSQLICVNLGHRRQEIIDAVAKAMNEIDFITSFFGLSNTYLVEVSQKLAKLTPGDLNHFHYTSGGSEAIDSAVKFIKAGADAIKLERASKTILDRIRAISDIGILVFAHLGICPQTVFNLTGGYRCASKTIESFETIYEESLVVEKAGASFLLLEGMPELPSKQIAKTLKIPVYGIGTGAQTDGCLMIFHDLCGLFPDFRPYFGKCFIPDVIDQFINDYPIDKTSKKFGRETKQDGLLQLSTLAIYKYIESVKSRQFPSSEYTYPLKEEELNDLRKSQYWNSDYE